MLKKDNKRILILMYHRIVSDDFIVNKISDPFEMRVLKRYFFDQIQYLRKEGNIISLIDCIEQIGKKEIDGDKQFVITFDDGYSDNFYNAFPILKTFNTPATIFLSTDYIDSPKEFWIDKLYSLFFEHNLSENNNIEISKVDYIFKKMRLYFRYKNFLSLRNKLMMMNNAEREKIISGLSLSQFENCVNSFYGNTTLLWQQIREMHNFGISFGAHTCSHQILTNLSPKESSEEILTSKSIIEMKLKNRVDLFAYPYGGYNTFSASIKETLKDFGFRCACTTIKGFNDLNADLFALRRIPIRNWELKRFIVEINNY